MAAEVASPKMGSELESLEKRVKHVTGHSEAPRLNRDCVDGGECHRMSIDIYKLWNTLNAIKLNSSQPKLNASQPIKLNSSQDLITRLDGALTYYEQQGYISYYVGYGPKTFLDLKTREVYHEDDQGARIVERKIDN
jgi:hypothetical protein